MRYDLERSRDECATAATTDTALIGLLIIGGVLLALATASKIVVAIFMAVLIVTAVVRFSTHMSRSTDRAGKDPASDKSEPPSA